MSQGAGPAGSAADRAAGRGRGQGSRRAADRRQGAGPPGGVWSAGGVAVARGGGHSPGSRPAD
uniref:Uncharacterized protein n=1 Tax=Caudovirales sp. ct0jG3 TaxID=2825756 RepID=A0A8S5NT55_9CAUD|nr:MAG TPA: hypothetical protein [Caudovirales sp. ct0jG3]